MTLDQVKDLVRFARSEGARRFRFGDLEVEFGAPVPEPVEAPKEEKPKTPEQIREEEERILFMSSGA